MKKILVGILVASLIMTAAELLYVHSTPVLGEGNLDQMSTLGETPRFPDTDHLMAKTYTIYYEHRPHVGDPIKHLYKTTLAGWWILDTMLVGIDMWQTKIFDQCDYEIVNRSVKENLIFWEKHRPAALTSQYMPIDSGTAIMAMAHDKWPNMRGKSAPPMAIGWLMLGDTVGGNSMILFEDGCGKANNMSGREFLREYAGMYSVYLARTAFTESVLDEQPAWKGILYMAYYPGYNKTWIVIYNIPEEELERSKITIDGAEEKTEVMYPFILVDGRMDDGKHRLDLSTPDGDYPIGFTVDLSPLKVEGIATTMQKNGRFTTVLRNTNTTVYLNSADAVLEGERQHIQFDKTMPPYNTTMLDVNFTKTLVNWGPQEPAPDEGLLERLIPLGGPRRKDKFCDLELTISYEADGRQQWLNKTMTLMAE
jgi:hypothetical protein